MKIPAIIIRTNDNWEKVIKTLGNAKVQITKTRNVEGDMHVTYPTSRTKRDHEGTHINRYTILFFFLDKTERRLAMRGLPAGVNTDGIKEDVIKQGVKIIEKHAMHTRRGLTKIIPLYVVKTPK